MDATNQAEERWEALNLASTIREGKRTRRRESKVADWTRKRCAIDKGGEEDEENQGNDEMARSYRCDQPDRRPVLKLSDDDVPELGYKSLGPSPVEIFNQDIPHRRIVKRDELHIHTRVKCVGL